MLNHSLRLATVLLELYASIIVASAQTRTLEGEIRDASTDLPIPFAVVTITASRQSSTADAIGQFVLRGVPNADYVVTASAPNYYSFSSTVRDYQGDLSRIQLSLTPRTNLSDQIIVTASGLPDTVKDTAQSVGFVDEQQIHVTRLTGLDAMLNSIPGVKAENQTDSEQVRVSIRGRDVRNSFGLIGIKLLIDAIPETDASGETPDLTGIDLGAAQSIEVVKGQMAARYGAGSAGVLNIITKSGSGEPSLDIENYGGSYGFVRNQLALSGGSQHFGYYMDGSRVVENGYRAQAAFFAYRVGAKFHYTPNTIFDCWIIPRFEHSHDELPGALTESELLANRYQASAQYLEYSANEGIMRVLGGADCNIHPSSNQLLNAMVFSRVLDYGLGVPFIYEAGHRPETGVQTNYSIDGSTTDIINRLIAGFSFQDEHDYLHEFNNVGGRPGTQLYADQLRDVTNNYVYLMDQATITKKLRVNAAVNYDRLQLHVIDHLGSASGAKSFGHVTYGLGVAYQFTSALSAYGNLSTGFETPTLTELGRSVTGTTGINYGLRAEKSHTGELGAWVNLTQRAYLNLCVFRTPVSNEIVPTGVGYPQQTYDNAAKTIHNGVESEVGGMVFKRLDWRVGYTYSDFYYQEYTNALGQNAQEKQIPALPRNHLYSSLDYGVQGFQLGGNIELVGKMFANDANTAQTQEYTTTTIYSSYNRQITERIDLRLLFSIRNIGNALYSAYIVPNDEFMEYYYPSPGRNYFGSLEITWRKPW